MLKGMVVPTGATRGVPRPGHEGFAPATRPSLGDRPAKSRRSPAASEEVQDPVQGDLGVLGAACGYLVSRRDRHRRKLLRDPGEFGITDPMKRRSLLEPRALCV